MNFEELDYRNTPIGEISLRRRHEPRCGVDVFEIKLGDEFLMTSLFTASEIALARLALEAHAGKGLDVLVGGLGLGYTAREVLSHQKVASLLVVEFLEAVIDWHLDALLPLGPELTGDPRCHFTRGDFFALAGGPGFDQSIPERRFDAILVDIDHSPEALLDDRSRGFYQADGLRRLKAQLNPGGIFALWSNDRPDSGFTDRLAGVFEQAWSEPVTFDNPFQDRPFTQTVYLARNAGLEGRSHAGGSPSQ